MVLPSDVAVILPAHDGEGWIAEAVADALRSLPGAIAIVVDDGSDDETSVRALDAGARVLRTELARGHGAALRVGIAASAAPWLLLSGPGGDSASAPALLSAREADLIRLQGRAWPLLIRGDVARSLPLRTRGAGLGWELRWRVARAGGTARSVRAVGRG
jgi:glycosyltransferase involved in cell wall biosynthesis